jgi:hypothetical protein
VTAFATTAFHFELPGDGWEDRSVQLFRSPDEPRAVLAVSRTYLGDEPPGDLADAIAGLPTEAYSERTILRCERTEVGPLDAQEAEVIAHGPEGADYVRVLAVSYYDLEVSFEWSGPASRREAVDASARRTIDSLRFRRR